MGTTWAFRAGEAYGFHLSPTRSRRWNLASGVWNTVLTYTGPVDKVEEFIATLILPQEISVKEDGDFASIEVSYPATGPDGNPSNQPDPVFTGWGLAGNFLQVPLLSMPRLQPTPDGLGFTPKVVADLLSLVTMWKRAVSEADVFTDLDFNAYREDAREYAEITFGNFPSPLRELLIQDAVKIFEELANGRDEVDVVQPVLRKIQVVTSSSQVKADVRLVGRFFTWAAVKAAEPTLDAAIIIGIDAFEEINTGATFYWQKRAPTVEVQSDGKRQITLEYWAWEGYDMWRYKQPIEPDDL